jgi:hypothetical protein
MSYEIIHEVGIKVSVNTFKVTALTPNRLASLVKELS